MSICLHTGADSCKCKYGSPGALKRRVMKEHGEGEWEWMEKRLDLCLRVCQRCGEVYGTKEDLAKHVCGIYERRGRHQVNMNKRRLLSMIDNCPSTSGSKMSASHQEPSTSNSDSGKRRSRVDYSSFISETKMTLKHPTVMMVVGPPGSGKTYIAMRDVERNLYEINFDRIVILYNLLQPCYIQLQRQGFPVELICKVPEKLQDFFPIHKITYSLSMTRMSNFKDQRI